MDAKVEAAYRKWMKLANSEWAMRLTNIADITRHQARVRKAKEQFDKAVLEEKAK